VGLRTVYVGEREADSQLWGICRTVGLNSNTAVHDDQNERLIANEGLMRLSLIFLRPLALSDVRKRITMRDMKRAKIDSFFKRLSPSSSNKPVSERKGP